ncbi:hypothetical protein MIND_00831800 [Mycena indigotica]|uniref:Nucleoprotein TPR/MLP1 domain-containing protein n=1 Tax=Mycena indigotica TaxID=2126181 RepID=A0A8H6SHL6_9AGAR|nr:uncharacterized protein MIND_00831800 [Mycena indigotica]KAF7298841.1 hypothetical protein MIND_00831800 [Mycena indigotica]
MFTRTDNLGVGVDWTDKLSQERQRKDRDGLVDILLKSKATIVVKEDIRAERWIKLIWNAAWNSLTALSLMRTSDFIQTSSEAVSVARSVFEETIEIGKAKGLEIPEDTLQDVMTRYQTLKGAKSSMLVDAMAKKPTEVESIIGYPLREARRLGIPAPTLTIVYALLKAMDWRHANPELRKFEIGRLIRSALLPNTDNSLHRHFFLVFVTDFKLVSRVALNNNSATMSAKTRRKSKASGLAEEGEHSSPGAAKDTLLISIPEDLDVDALSALLPEASLESQSNDGIVALYRRLAQLAADLDAAVRQRDEDQATVERMEVELDQALQDKESISRQLEGSTEHSQRELAQVKQERDELASAKAALSAQISTLSTSQSSSSTEVENLRHKLDDTEREKRDLVGVISRLKQDSSQREEEVHTLRANLKEARQEHQTLESQLRELRSSETSVKFKLDSLSQQLALSQSEAERANAELLAKSEEYSKQRRTKHAELVTLQANFDALTQTHATTQATLKSLQSAHTAQSHQLTQALTRVQDLTGQLAEQESNYAAEASHLNRLVAAMQAREARTQEVVDGIEDQMAMVNDKADRREAALKEELRMERVARGEAEKRVDQLEEVVERMGRGDLPAPRAADILNDGIVNISPTVAMVSKAQKSGKTFTEVYTDYVRLQEDYAKKCTEYDRMDQTLSAVLSQIEERAPIITQQRAEYERLQSEASHLASQLSQAISDRDTQAKQAQDSSQKFSASIRENEVLQQQLTDLGRQVQHLLREIGRRDNTSLPSDLELEALEPMASETIGHVITDQLVLYRSIPELQAQNQKLLRVVRELGDKMENEEKEYREAIEREQGEAIREAHEAMQELAEQLERQKTSSENIIKAYVKERDTYKALLARTERGGSSTNGIHSEINGFDSNNLPPTSGDLAKELADVQSEFEAYRTEMGVDSVRLREDLIASQREVGQLSAALAKASAKNDLLNERHRMTEDLSSVRSREVDDLTKRNQQLFDQWTRLDIECSRVTEDLQTANARIEQLRNECANLRAEKKIWETVQGRLVDENKTLALERSHLSDLMGNVQKMHNDLERSGENDRRRLENQLQMLETQNQDLRHQLTKERESVRHLSLQKELEMKELQVRLDKLTQEFAKTRESLVGAETSKTHLEQRVEELTRLLKGSEEKLSVYERRSSTVTGITQAMDQDLPREQQLEAEVAELRSALKIAEVDLANARNHVEQFRQISEANEEALNSLNATYDEYKASTEAQIARHESEYDSIQERLKAVQQDLAQFTAKYNELLKTTEEERKAWKEDKKVLEDTIAEISSSEQTSANDRSSREHQIRELEDRAKAAEAKYRQEVIAHGDSFKLVDSLKEQLATAQTTARERQTAAETAQVKLASSESSWGLQKETLDKELSDLNRRQVELTSQNSVLHQHLESVTSQASRIRQAAADSSASAPAERDTSTEDADTKLAELRSVVTYLRHEKEIVELQLNVTKQESTRLKAQNEHLNQSLKDVRATLSEERERAVEAAASEAQHAELLERTNQINVLRESNATLRVESENNAKKARELETKLKTFMGENAPLKEENRAYKAELEARDAQIKRMEDENRRWQERNSQLLVKYDRVDPAEMQALKDEAERLKAQLADAEKAKVEIESSQAQNLEASTKRIGDLESSLRTHKEHQLRINANFKERMGQANQARSTLQTEKSDLMAQVTSLTAEVEALKAAPTPAASQEPVTSSDDAATILRLNTELEGLRNEKATLTANAGVASISPDVEQLKTALEKEKTDRAAAEAKIKESDQRHNSLLQRAQALAREKTKFTEEKNAAVAAAIAQTKSEMQPATTDATLSEELVQKHTAELKALEETLSSKHAAELKAAVDLIKTEMQAAVQAARMENAGATGTAPNVDALIKEAIAKHDESLAAARKEEINAAVDRGRQEANAKAKLKDSQLVKSQKKVKDLETLLQSYREKGIIPADSPITVSPTTLSTATSVPSTTAPTAPVASTSAAPAANRGGAAPRGGPLLQEALVVGPWLRAGAERQQELLGLLLLPPTLLPLRQVQTLPKGFLLRVLPSDPEKKAWGPTIRQALH